MGASRKEDSLEPNVPIQFRHGRAAFLPLVAEYPLFTTDINTDSSLVGSHCVNGQVPIQGRCCVTAQRNNTSHVGTWVRREPTSTVGRGLWSAEGLSGPVIAQPGLALWW